MKKTVLVLLGSVIGLSVMAQAKKSSNAPVTTIKPTKEILTPVSFETSLVSGTITLTKAFQQGNNNETVTVYALSKRGDVAFNNNKPITISLSRKSYDSVFTKTNAELSGRYASLNQFITENKISLTDENGWITLIKHYNNAFQ